MGLKIATAAASPATSAAYVPEFRGNRLAADPFWVELLPMTHAEYEAARSRDLAITKANQAMAAARKHLHSVVAARVSVVHGVAMEDGVAIEDGKALVAAVLKSADPALAGLLEELYGAIVDMSALEEGRRPNS
jgi:hypothetical protein